MVVFESCEVWLSAQAYPGSTSASASNGLDARFCTNTSTQNVPIEYYPGYVIGSGSGAYSSGSAARVMTGGASIKVECSPTGSCSTNNGPFSVSATYSVQVYPVQLSLTNTKKVYEQHFSIVGKTITAVVVVPSPVSFKQGTFSYCVGGYKFKDFEVPASQQYGKMNYLNASDYKQMGCTWTWSDAGGQNVTGTVEIQYAGIDLGEIKATRFVEVLTPGYKLSPTYGDAGFTDSTRCDSGTQAEPAISAKYQAYVPALFKEGVARGDVAITQLCSLNRHHWALPPIGESQISCTNSLDHQYPYNSWANAADVGSTLDHEMNDYPGTEFGAMEYKFTASDSFKAYLMFIPAGSGVQPVTLARATWTWQASSENVNGSWVEYLNSVSGTASEKWTNNPEWTSKYSSD